MSKNPSIETEIFGQEKALSFLKKILKTKNLAHAYLFVGPESIGKTAIAEWFIKQLVGEQGFSHPDVFVLERLVDEKTGKEKRVLTVDQVRSLRASLSLSSFLGGYKVAFIKEADKLNAEAANALLKILEEPPEKTIFLLRASFTEQLPATIVSRCQVLRFALVSSSEIEDKFRQKNFSAQQVHFFALYALGRPGRVFSLIKSPEKQELFEQEAKNFLSLWNSPVYKRLSLVSAWLPKNEQNRQGRALDLLEQWEWMMRDLLLSSLGLTENRFYDLSKEKQTNTPFAWVSALTCLQKARASLLQNGNPVLCLQEVVLKL